jgi:hypothetical protein
MIELRANDPSKIIWDSFILVIAIYNSITVPLEISFDPEIVEILESFNYYTIDLVFTCIFFLDILINANTTFYDTDGEEIFEKGRIVRNYASGSFLIDLISSLPLKGGFKIFNILKIIRLRKLSGIIDKLNYHEDTKSVSNILFHF